VEGFGDDEVRPEDVGSGDEETEKVDQVELAGCALRAARLQLPLAKEGGIPIGKTRGALRGMWLDAILRVYGINREQGGAREPMSRKGFGGGPGPVGKAKKEGEKGRKTELASETESMPTGGVAAQPKTDRGKAGKKGGECYLHGPFLGDMLPGQTLRM